MTEFTYRLHARPYGLIATGQKSIEARLYDEKRQQIRVGDTICFVNRADESQSLRVVVTALFREKDFYSLFKKTGVTHYGGSSVTESAEAMSTYYRPDAVARYGVIGIAFERLT